MYSGDLKRSGADIPSSDSPIFPSADVTVQLKHRQSTEFMLLCDAKYEVKNYF